MYYVKKQKNRKKYDAWYKRRAVELSFSHGRAAEVEQELRIDSALLYRWWREHNQYAHNSFPGKGKPKMTDSEKEIARLKAELYDVTMDRDILKKAISIFSVSDKKSSDL